MSILVTAEGFDERERHDETFVDWADLSGGVQPKDQFRLDISNDAELEAIAPWLDRVELVRVRFPATGDGRGFSIACLLRDMGYVGRLRAAGPLIPDQVRAAWRVGFDEIELPDGHAAKRPEHQWIPPEQGAYRQRLFG